MVALAFRIIKNEFTGFELEKRQALLMIEPRLYKPKITTSLIANLFRQL